MYGKIAKFTGHDPARYFWFAYNRSVWLNNQIDCGQLYLCEWLGPFKLKLV